MTQKICCGGFNLGEGLNLDLKTKTLSTTGGVGGTQSDWNENDPQNPAYVKNRPFYDGRMVIEIVPEQTVNFQDMGYEGQWVGNALITEKPLLNDICTVIWDGKSYECTVNDLDGAPCLGNQSILNPFSDNTGEPFLMGFIDNLVIYTLSKEQIHNFKITKSSGTVHKIPEEFLPEYIILSSTPGSAKRFKITVTDDGAIKAEEVK